jgi:hypothetical protein
MIKLFGNITAHGVEYKLPDKPPSELVWVDPKGHVNCWCSVLGGTSGSSSSPRTEFRETINEFSSDKYNWIVDGKTTHTLAGTVRVELAPSSGKVIVGQIHAHLAGNPFLMVTWWNGYIRVDMRFKPDGDAVNVLKLACPLSKSFKYLITISPEGIIHINLNGETFTTNVDTAWKACPFYYKFGAYCIDHEGPAEEGAWVVYEDFAALHDEAA